MPSKASILSRLVAETASSIKSKLGITTLSGSNTGDETNATLLTKLGLSSISGVNTGDETLARVAALWAGATAKTTPVNADSFILLDSAASNGGKIMTYQNLKAAIIAGLSSTLGGTTSSSIVHNTVDKGTVSTGTVTFDVQSANFQRLQVGGALTVAFSNWPASGVFAPLILKLVNGGSATVTLPTINYIQPNGVFTTSFSTYLASIGRSSLQASGTDLLYVYSDSAGAGIVGKLL